jgi:hypothetical protein
MEPDTGTSEQPLFQPTKQTFNVLERGDEQRPPQQTPDISHIAKQTTRVAWATEQM